jgi:hypothetical protein
MEMSRETGVYGGPGTSSNIAQAYIQFGGLTAGRTTSFFTNGDVANENWGTVRFYDYPDVNLLLTPSPSATASRPPCRWKRAPSRPPIWRMWQASMPANGCPTSSAT